LRLASACAPHDLRQMRFRILHRPHRQAPN
jgi:hypothetical protein